MFSILLPDFSTFIIQKIVKGVEIWVI